MREVIAYGSSTVDNLVHIDHLPTQKDEGAQILETSWQFGGKVASALTAIGQLGASGSMIGMVGADFYGKCIIRDFERYNIDTSHILQDGTSAFSLVLSDEVTHGRNIIFEMPKGRKYGVEDIDEAFVAQHKILHLENADAVSHRLADIMHQAGGIVTVDGDGYSDEMQAMMPKFDVFIGSEFYYTKLFGESEDFESNLEKVRKMGPKIAVFTLGDRGSVVKWDGGFYFAPGYKVKVVDTVGAGDVYHGAYIYALLQNMRPDEAAQFSNAVSSIKCTAIGGRAGVPNREMVDSYMKTGEYDRTLIEEKLARYKILA